MLLYSTSPSALFQQGALGSLGAGLHLVGGEAYIQFKSDLVDAQGNITDDSVRGFLKSYVDQFAAFARKFTGAQRAA